MAVKWSAVAPYIENGFASGGQVTRGPIVDEAALTHALKEGWLAGAGLDVFEVEPLPADAPIRSCPNVVFAPHGLAWTTELARDNSLEACGNLLADAQGRLPGGIVNRAVIGNSLFQDKLKRWTTAE